MVPHFQSETRLHASPYQHMLLLLQLWNVELKKPHSVRGTNWSLVSSLLLSDSILHLGGRTWFGLLHFSHSAFSASAALSLDHTGCLTASIVSAACTQRVITIHDQCDLLPIQFLPHWVPGTRWLASCRSGPVCTCLRTSALAALSARLFSGLLDGLVPPFFQCLYSETSFQWGLPWTCHLKQQPLYPSIPHTFGPFSSSPAVFTWNFQNLSESGKENND